MATTEDKNKKTSYQKLQECNLFQKDPLMESALKCVFDFIRNRQISLTTYASVKTENNNYSLVSVPKTEEELREDYKYAHPDYALDNPDYYYSQANNPLMAYGHDKYLDKLYRKYNIGIYDRIYPSFYEWFETYPTCNKKEYKKKYKKLSDKKKKQIKKLKTKYKNAKLDENSAKYSTIDWIQVLHYEKKRGHYCFDSREVWNLDSVIPLFLYPRLKHLKKYMIGYDYDFKSMKDYKKKVINPILDALELHIVLEGIDGANYISDWCHETGKTVAEEVEFLNYVKSKIEYGYHLLASYIHTLWD